MPSVTLENVEASRINQFTEKSRKLNILATSSSIDRDCKKNARRGCSLGLWLPARLRIYLSYHKLLQARARVALATGDDHPQLRLCPVHTRGASRAEHIHPRSESQCSVCSPQAPVTRLPVVARAMYTPLHFSRRDWRTAGEEKKGEKPPRTIHTTPVRHRPALAPDTPLSQLHACDACSSPEQVCTVPAPLCSS